MHGPAWFASVLVFLLFMTSVISFYLAASFDHTGRTDRLARLGIRTREHPQLLLRAQPRWRWVPQWVIIGNYGISIKHVPSPAAGFISTSDS